MKHLPTLKIVLQILLILPINLFSQKDSTKYKLVESLTKNISISYLNLDLAKAMCDTIKNKFYSNKYDTLLNLDEFVYEVNKDLRKVSKDNHITITPAHNKLYDYDDYTDYLDHSLRYRRRLYKKNKREYERFLAKYKKVTKYDMVTYGEIKILPGNIGYVEIKSFQSTCFLENSKGKSFKSVLKYLKNTSSIIFDFRKNLGGNVGLSANFCSYFTDKPNSYFITTESVFRYDSSATIKEIKLQKKFYTDDEISNKIIGDKNIYILTSKRTFSAAELTTYKLKELNSNVKIIGEKTTGGGNGYYDWNLEKYYWSVIPSVKIYNENTSNYNLEANGVTPDIITTADSAFDIAYKLSLSSNESIKKVKTKYFKKNKTITDENEEYFKNKYRDFIGDFRKIKVMLENGRLYIVYDFYMKELLIPEATDFFVNETFEFVRFKRDKKNNVIEIEVKHKDGYLEKFRKFFPATSSE